ncbi:hypothetical protein LZ318_27660 [Saccharopolyspora indica]|uniref:hypothetical protein n=1 Tax=Saccharopolyspora indica TaxID=1229659 RepID=UPI0022EA2BC6|nr:hypothetical protein [Saccharopolyspora indica]MDA3645046.1 hypothetical protein [Saccharopolyspora indica]
MKLGRTVAAAALLGATALPLTAAVGWADEPKTAPVAEEQKPVAPAPVDEKTPAPEQSRPVEPPKEGATPEAVREKTAQVSERPVGAPETGGGPVESGFGPAALGGAAALAVAGGGAAVVLRRRRAGAN